MPFVTLARHDREIDYWRSLYREERGISRFLIEELTKMNARLAPNAPLPEGLIEQPMTLDEADMLRRGES